MFRRLSLLVVPALVVAAASVIASAPADASVGAPITLSLTGYQRTVLANGHLFILGGPNDGILVRNLDGTPDATTPVIAETDATDITASPDGTQLYVALDTANEIGVIDTTALTQTTIPTGDDTCPQTVAATATAVWFGYGCSDDSGQAQIGVADLTTPPAVVTLAVAQGFVASPHLVTSPAAPGLLFAADYTQTSGMVQSFTISDDTLTSAGTASTGQIDDMSITADGQTLMVASGTQVAAFTTSSLASGGVYVSSTSNALAVTTSSAGYIAAGLATPASPDVQVLNQAGTLVTSFSLGTGDDGALAQAGLTFSADGSTLYAVSNDGADTVELHVISAATVAPSTITLTGSKTATRTKALVLTGTLRSNGVARSGVTVSISRKNLDGIKALPSVSTNAAGGFAVNDTPTVGGTVVYTVTAAADAHHASATASFTVTVSRTATSLKLATDHTAYAYHATVHITATLGTTYKNRTVTISDTAYGHASVTLRTAKVSSKGILTTSFVGSVNTTVTVSFSGDEIYAPVTVSKKITVAAGQKSELAGYYKKSKGYYYFHQSEGGAIAVGILPNVRVGSRHVVFVMQVLKSGKWVSATGSDTEPTDSAGIAVTVFDGAKAHQLRVRGEFRGDVANAAVDGQWWYLEFT